MVFVGGALVGSWDTGQSLPPSTAPRIQGRDMGEVMLGEHLGVPEIHGVQEGDEGVSWFPLSSREFGSVQGSHGSTL